ncbi:prostate and testis expressed protein 1 [Ochotona princeps]|uniref:prostate and testis expressed protein 1 n=1 Tax=Ochotona princeps TaxID=9978 RepID=UPI0027144BB0|nr:prostate and testis expressed protein 1 [Ochotona princeps]
MDKLLVLGVTLLCLLHGAVAIECRVCALYHRNSCIHGKGTCTLKENESCVRLDIMKEDNHENEGMAIMGCQKNCNSLDFHKQNIVSNTRCCQDKDFCNEF